MTELNQDQISSNDKGTLSVDKDTVSHLVKTILAERKLERRWRIIFRVAKFALVAFVLIYLFTLNFSTDSSSQNDFVEEKHIALISINGVIAKGAGVDSGFIIDRLEEAFDQDNSTAVLLHINSPGGSPVQSSLIYDAIMKFKQDTGKTTYAVIEDIGASGAYYIAAAADKIYANKSSIVGSIGVIMSSFGMQDMLQKIGLESRVITAGKHKDIGNPARPESAFEKQFFKKLLGDIHANFIADVERGRGDRLRGDKEVLYSGLYWTALEAKELGLIDGLGSLSSVLDLEGVDNVVNYTEKDPFEKFFDIAAKGFWQSIGGKVQQGFLIH